MGKVKVADLKPHPRNQFFFDPMTGNDWNEFLESIKIQGVKVGILATQDLIIISGHERVRACKELGIDEIECKIEQFDDEDAEVLAMIDINLRQRGHYTQSDLKQGRISAELKRLYGIKRGGNHGNQYAEAKPQLSVLANTKTVDDVARKMGASPDTLLRREKISRQYDFFIPEIKKIAEENILTEQEVFDHFWPYANSAQEQKAIYDYLPADWKRDNDKARIHNVINDAISIYKSTKKETANKDKVVYLPGVQPSPDDTEDQCEEPLSPPPPCPTPQQEEQSPSEEIAKEQEDIDAFANVLNQAFDLIMQCESMLFNKHIETKRKYTGDKLLGDQYMIPCRSTAEKKIRTLLAKSKEAIGAAAEELIMVQPVSSNLWIADAGERINMTFQGIHFCSTDEPTKAKCKAAWKKYYKAMTAEMKKNDNPSIIPRSETDVIEDISSSAEAK